MKAEGNEMENFFDKKNGKGLSGGAGWKAAPDR